MELTSDVKAEILAKLPGEMRDQIAQKMDNDAHAVLTIHSQYNDEGKKTGSVTLALDQDESEGTRKFFNLAGPLVDAVLNGKMVVIDELDARLHPLLIKAIVRLFNSAGNASGAQMLGVCHDTSILDRELLRRDQVCFVEKDRFGATRVAKLVEFKARKEEPFYKNYLEGKYGGIPFITNFENSFKHGQAQERAGV
jgi:AAA15 family ATPase/GTPase